MQNLTEVELKNFNLSNAITLSGMFEDCSALTRIDFSNCNFSSTNDQTYFEGMFSGCSSLSTIKLPTTSNALIELPRVFNDNLGATYSVMPSASATVDEIYATIVSEGGVGGSESQPDQTPEINDSAQVEPQEEDKLKSIIEIAMAITFVSLPVGFGVMLLVMCIKGKKPE